MLNQLVLVGRLKEMEIIESEEGKKYNIVIAVPRSFKNAEGEYETDFIPIKLFGSIAENTFEYCKKGDLVGIKGRVEANNNGINIIAEKITFLSSKKEEQ